MSGAIVVGSGRTVWEDLAAIGQPDWPVLALNEMIIFSPRLDHAVSHHARKLQHWLALRPQPTQAVRVHSSAAGPGVMRTWPEFAGAGSSALLAVRIAAALGHAPIWVAGVPLDGRGYIWGPADAPHKDHAGFRPKWAAVRAELVRAQVYSPSGFLRELLGAPVSVAA